MKASTVAALERINREFYHRRALEFSDSRSHGWPGWQLVLELARGHLRSERISVLDLACGNARFLPQLERLVSAAGPNVRYLGVDASVALLALAARAADAPRASKQATGFEPINRRLFAADLVHRPLAQLDPSARFDLIVSFGLMHHIPSRARRLRLLKTSAERLSPGGLLAVSFWQFGDKERFQDRFRPWNDPEAGGVDPEDLEDGDSLLAWGDAGAVRYCHFASPIEARSLVEGLGLDAIASFTADGSTKDLNLYWVLRRPRS